MRYADLFHSVPATQPPGTQPVQSTSTPTGAVAQVDTNTLTAGLTGKNTLQDRLVLIQASPPTVKAVCLYLQKVPGYELPEALHGLDDDQLCSLRISLHSWMEHFKSEVPKPLQPESSVSLVFNSNDCSSVTGLGTSDLKCCIQLWRQILSERSMSLSSSCKASGSS